MADSENRAQPAKESNSSTPGDEANPLGASSGAYVDHKADPPTDTPSPLSTSAKDKPASPSQEDTEETGSDTSVQSTGEPAMPGIPSNEVKNIILQVLSPYFDDGDTATLQGEVAEDTSPRYDHAKSLEWTNLICEGILERLIAMAVPYKFMVHCVIMRKCGAGMHICSSCYYGPNDGCISHAHDLSEHIYAVVSVYWCAVS